MCFLWLPCDSTTLLGWLFKTCSCSPVLFEGLLWRLISQASICQAGRQVLSLGEEDPLSRTLGLYCIINMPTSQKPWVHVPCCLSSLVALTKNYRLKIVYITQGIFCSFGIWKSEIKGVSVVRWGPFSIMKTACYVFAFKQRLATSLGSLLWGC